MYPPISLLSDMAPVFVSYRSTKQFSSATVSHQCLTRWGETIENEIRESMFVLGRTRGELNSSTCSMHMF